MSHVYVYWQGVRPPYIDLCLRTLRQNCYRTHCFHLINDANIEATLSTAHPNWRKIPELGVLSDVVRACCLARTGGWYMDADTVGLKQLPDIPDGIDAAYVTWSQPPHRIVAGNIYVSREVGQKWLANINAKLAAGKWSWTELGEGCITPVIDTLPEDRKLHLPLDTFFPIEIDLNKGIGSAKFFARGDIDSLITENTVAVGLNNSWFASRPQAAMTYKRINAGDYSNGTFLSSVMKKAADSITKPMIGVCCSTFRRPRLLGQLLRCMERQNYPGVAFLVAMEDGTSKPIEYGKRWSVHYRGERYPSLAQKRNSLAQHVAAIHEPDILIPWDDDDLPCPWALSAIADASQWADFIRPSQVLIPGRNGELLRYKTYWREDKADKAFHPTWGYSVAAFNAVGGYPDHLSHGEDLGLAKRMRDAGISEADPIELGHLPYLLFAPHNNEHFGYYHKNYSTWPDRLKSQASEVVPTDSKWALTPAKIGDRVHARSFAGDWYESDQQ